MAGTTRQEALRERFQRTLQYTIEELRDLEAWATANLPDIHPTFADIDDLYFKLEEAIQTNEIEGLSWVAFDAASYLSQLQHNPSELFPHLEKIWERLK